MPSTVRAAMDQRLVVDTTYICQIMQTQILKVTVVSATPINAYQDSSPRSLQVLHSLLLQITRCLDSTSDNKQMREELASKIDVTDTIRNKSKTSLT